MKKILCLMALVFTMTIPIAHGGIYDSIVDAGGDGDSTTIDGGLDANGSILVKSGTYASEPSNTMTLDQADTVLIIEPGTTITGTIEVTGSNVTVIFGPGSSLSGEFDITTGTGCSIIGRNGVSLGLIDINTADNYITGNGWGTQVLDLITVDGADCMLTDFAIDTKTVPTTNHGINASSSAPRLNVIGVKWIESDSDGYIGNNGADDNLILACHFDDTDGQAINIPGDRARIIGNYTLSAADQPIVIGANGDNSVVVSNMVKDQAAGKNAIVINASGENVVVVGNRVDDLGTTDGILDLSGTSTVGGSNEVAF